MPVPFVFLMIRRWCRALGARCWRGMTWIECPSLLLSAVRSHCLNLLLYLASNPLLCKHTASIRGQRVFVALVRYLRLASKVFSMESRVKSKQRVSDHGEVFTPSWMVENMLDLVKEESERIDSRFLEPACGDGNFLMQVLGRKLAAVQCKYGKSDFDRSHYALRAVSRQDWSLKSRTWRSA